LDRRGNFRGAVILEARKFYQARRFQRPPYFYRILSGAWILYVHSKFPQQFSAAIFRSNFPQQFSAANFRSNFPQQISAWILGIRHNFHPQQISAWILGTRHNFHETQKFHVFVNILSGC
jgi:hypothetical protein